MLGHKPRDFRPLTAVSLEELVPEDNFYRQVERSIDLSFVHDLANDFYSNIGRPSIDPVVFFKLQLIAFFEGIRSERRSRKCERRWRQTERRETLSERIQWNKIASRKVKKYHNCI